MSELCNTRTSVLIFKCKLSSCGQHVLKGFIDRMRNVQNTVASIKPLNHLKMWLNNTFTMYEIYKSFSSKRYIYVDSHTKRLCKRVFHDTSTQYFFSLVACGF